MFNFLKYILLFLLGYKVVKELFKSNAEKHSINTNPGGQTIHSNDPAQNASTLHNKFEEAEVIDFEELK